jgi:hypothetical protein
MHKSAITHVSLIIMSTLIMLVPFTSINFSNVKAQEYGTYDDEYDDDMYSTYPTEVNKYECQKGPFEGFFVSSVEFCKKIPVIDNRGGNNDNGSGNGTVGPQGEPGPAGAQGEPGPAGQAGQQGIPGVSGPPGPRGLSGPAGPEGIQGPIGLTGLIGANSTVPGPQGERGFNGTNGINGMQGPAGPAGISKINGSNYYSVIGNVSVVNTTSPFASSEVSCFAGDFALSGEYELIRADAVSPTVSFFGSFGPNPPTSWLTVIVGIPPQGVRTTVNCFDNSP